MRGRRSSRFSTARLSCERAMTGTLQLAGERLEATADLGDLLLPAVAADSSLIDELDVVDARSGRCSAGASGGGRWR